MRAIFMTILGASTILFGTLTMTGHSASAKSLLQLKCQHYPVEGPSFAALTQAQAENMAKQLWVQKVTQLFGHSWANYSKAKNKDYSCVALKKMVCKLTARPCKHISTAAPLTAFPPAANPGFIGIKRLPPRQSTRRARPQRLGPPPRLGPPQRLGLPPRRDQLRFRR